MSFTLPELDFDYSDPEPYIDAKKMEIHHTKHHASYLEKFNLAIENTELQHKIPSAIFAEISKQCEAVRNYGRGFLNHTLLGQCLTPNSTEKLNTRLVDAITKYFRALEKLKEEFSNAEATQFGSGWAWLVLENKGELMVASTANQNNPLMDISPLRGIPLLCVDVWKHPYYLNYQTKRPEYIQAFWNVVNGQKVAERFNKYSGEK